MRITAAASLLLLAGIVALTGCGNGESSDEEGTGEENISSDEARQTGATDESHASSTSDEVWIFGGSNYDELLGCVTCDSYSSDSVLSTSGRYGNKYGSSTIWNEYGQYGSDYSSNSPWNEYTSTGPKLFTKDKKSYFGFFTKNQYRSERTHLRKAIEILDAGRAAH